MQTGGPPVDLVIRGHIGAPRGTSRWCHFFHFNQRACSEIPVCRPVANLSYSVNESKVD